MKCTKPLWQHPEKECEFDHPCPFHDLVINFEDNPPSIALPMDNVELIKEHLPWLIRIAMNEGEKYNVRKVILTGVEIKDGKIGGTTYIQPHIPPNWISVDLRKEE